MAATRHNPARRALLAGAMFAPFVQASAPAVAAAASPRAAAEAGTEWDRMLRAYNDAADRLLSFEQKTSGAPMAMQDYVESQHGELSCEMTEALCRLLCTPAPDVEALARKLDVTIEHEVCTLEGGDECLAALRQDAWRLAEAARAATVRA